MKNTIEIQNLQKKYTEFESKNLNIQIPSGTIVGLIGENGAGKTTLIKCILNTVSYNGNIRIFGVDNTKENIEKNEKIGVVLDDTFFPEILTPSDIEKILKRTYKTWDTTFYNHYLQKFKLPKEKQIKTFSKGMRKKLEIIVALSHHPELLILDEPTSGLDPVVRSEILELFLKFLEDENHTILFSTHITSDLEHIADYIIFIDNGTILLAEEKDKILDSYGILKCDEKTFQTVAKENIIRYKKNKYNYEVLVRDRKKLQKENKDYCIDKPTLEDIMILYIKGGNK